MSGWRFIIRSLVHHWRINLTVALGVAAATAVLTGALLVGDSVRGSLHQLTLERLGKIELALVKLDDRERHIIRNRFGLLGGKELTLEEIGKTLNLSRERVRQLEREAKDKLRANLQHFHPQIRYSLV